MTAVTSGPEPDAVVGVEPGEERSSSQGTRRSAEQLREIAVQGAETLRDARAEDIIAWATAQFGPRWAVASSMQDAVLTHLISVIAPGTRVLFLETGYHFSETLATRDEVARRYDLDVVDVLPELTVAEQDERYGKDLFASNPDLCCLLRKTTPLYEALQHYEGWGTGLRRAESATRANAPVVGFDETHELVKVNPIVAWSDEDVARYAATHEVIRNPLVERGYPSIGCAPCTRAVRPGEDPRAGRWSGTGKTECGIHQ